MSWVTRQAAEATSVTRQAAEARCEFGGVELQGTTAAWLLERQRACGGQLRPTPIQAKAMRPILAGRSVALKAPTGTGKTLAYLLPLWQRFVDQDQAGAQQTGRGKCLLIIAPSVDLQMQIGRVARELAGPGAEGTVLVLGRNLPDLDEQMRDARAIVATPTLLLEAMGLHEAWGSFAANVGAIVLDEADGLLPGGGARSWNLGGIMEKLTSGRLGGPPQPPQLVAVSASLDNRTLSLLETVTGIVLDAVRAEAPPRFGSKVVKRGPPEAEEGQRYSEREVMWPEGLQHHVMVAHGLLRGHDGINELATWAVMPIADAVRALEPAPSRICVILSEARQSSERGESTSKYLKRLRTLLPGFQVSTVSAAVSAAASQLPSAAALAAQAYLSDLRGEGDGEGGGRRQEVILGRSEAIRGLDIPGIDVVIIVGDVANAREYMHLAGRAARCVPGQERPTGGVVISIVERQTKLRLKKWGSEMGISFETFDPQSGSQLRWNLRPSRGTKATNPYAMMREAPSKGGFVYQALFRKRRSSKSDQ